MGFCWSNLHHCGLGLNPSIWEDKVAVPSVGQGPSIVTFFFKHLFVPLHGNRYYFHAIHILIKNLQSVHVLLVRIVTDFSKFSLQLQLLLLHM